MHFLGQKFSNYKFLIKLINFNIFLNFIFSLVVKYPSSKSLSYFWNGGSFVAIVIVIQFITGILLVFYFIPRIEAFRIVDYISREAWRGFFIRCVHLNFSSLIFVRIYFHMFRGVYYISYRLIHVWSTGVTLLLLTIITAFLGYVLPWGQISFWGATVITGLVSAVPYFGDYLVIWLWGGYNVNTLSLRFFFVLHFLIPFIILGTIIIHLILLHFTRRTRIILIHERFTKIKFTPYFTIKDFINFFLIFLFIRYSFIYPWSLGDSENWIYANPIQSPVHILPEWYFLFAYAILRSIPNKLGGVIALCLRVIIFYLFSFKTTYKTTRKLYSQIFILLFLIACIVLTFIGAQPVERPFLDCGQYNTLLYFLLPILLI